MEEDSPAILVDEATVRCGGNIILSEVDLEIRRGARAAILGPNGCGKSTLLRTLAGVHTPEMGRVVLGATSMAWLRQEATAGSNATVMEEATAEMTEMDAKRRLDNATVELSTAESPEDVERAMAAYEKASEEFEAHGGYDMEDRAAAVLKGLSFSERDFNRPCSELSGGWQMKVALARALLKKGDLLFLDEPTNHMDASAKSWLASYLANDLPRDSTLLVVTHDRFLLEQIRLNTIVEISDKRLIKFNVPTIERWQEERKRLSAKLGEEIRMLEVKIKTDTAWAQKWGAKTAFATKAQSRMKLVEKMKRQVNRLKEMTRGLPADEILSKDGKKEELEDGMLPLADMGNVSLRLPDPPLKTGGPPSGVLLELKKADISYGANPVIANIDLKLEVGSRVALVGPNGAGKTTLLRHLLGSMELQKGTRKLGEGSAGTASVALFTQDLAQDLPPDMTPVDYVLQGGGSMQIARATLGALGLKSEAHNQKIGALSGGEKARVALAVFATTPTDVLLLDEPTNHLDRVAVTALANGLRAHSGAVLVSSHDQAFIDALQTTDKAVVTKATDTAAGSLRMESSKVPA
eukprot:TRINITY_DN104613_c0_g1_i1.p1 TRINITY_DN104613_c0_g1~~TRINITY_DN104613_c0_g1_i1.p1  ORF type:complete len:681 (+),score=142.05 TRINITY_DN104613_c0_g1_i1:305-2044(+)